MKVQLMIRLRGSDVTLDEGVYDLDPKYERARYLRDNLDALIECGAVKRVEEEPEEPESAVEAAVVEPPEKAATTGRKRGRRPRKRKTE